MALALRDIDDDLGVAIFLDDLKALSVIRGHEGLPTRIPGVVMEMSFEDFMSLIDEILESMIGLGSLDLPDFAYRNWYDANQSPAETARAAVEYAKTH